MNSMFPSSPNTEHRERLVHRVLRALADHECLRLATDERAAALATYARRAVIRGAPFDRETLDGLAPLSTGEILERSANLPDKLTPAASEHHARLAEMRDTARRQESVERFFGDRDTVVAPLLPDTPVLSDRIDEAIARHNAAVADGAGVGRYRNMLLERVSGTIDDVFLIDFKYSLREHRREQRISTVEALAGVRCWELVEDLEQSRVGRNDLRVEKDYESNLTSRSLVDLYHVKPRDFNIVYSRDYRLIGECSTGQRWHNCYTEDANNFASVGAHIEHGGIVAYLVDKDDREARYPFARILMTPKQNDRGEAVIYDLSRSFGSYEDAGDGIVEHFRSSVFDVARRFGEGNSGRFQRGSNIPYSDASGAFRRIAVWTEQDLLKVADEAIDKSGRKGSVAYQVERKRRFETVWKRRTERALKADVEAAWKGFEEAKPVVIALAREIGREEARRFVVELRDHAFRYEPDGITRYEESLAVEAMRSSSDRVLAKLGEEKRQLFEAGVPHLFRVAASPTDCGDVVACALIASLGDDQQRERSLFARADQVGGWLHRVQDRRLRHLSEIADTDYWKAQRRCDAMREKTTAVPDRVGARAILNAFQNTWYSLKRAVEDAFGRLAWERVQAVVARDGMRAGLERIENLCPRTLGWRVVVLKFVPGERGKALRTRVLSRVSVMLAEVVPKWDEARGLLDASRWSREISDAEKNDLLLEVLIMHHIPPRFVQRSGLLADLRREFAYGVCMAGTEGCERLLARLLAPQLVDAAEADCRSAEAALQAAADRRHKPKQMAGWLGATEETVKTYCWLTDIELLEKSFTAENREARNRVDAEDVARRAHKIIRFHMHADLPEAGLLVNAVHRRLKERFSEYF